MNLLDLLTINRRSLPRDTTQAVKYCCAHWEECGQPTDAPRLAEFLDGVLKYCADAGLRYPKVLLLRLKQLQCGEWPVEELKRDEDSVRNGSCLGKAREK